MKRILTIIVALVVIALIAVWLPSRPTAIEKEIGGQLWTLVKLTVDADNVSIPEDAQVTLQPMGGRRYSGGLGINGFDVHLAINRLGEIKFTGEGSGVTEMGGPTHIMAFEEIYQPAFWKIQTAKVSGSTLVLDGPGVRLEYEGTPAPPLDNSGSPEDPVSTTVGE